MGAQSRQDNSKPCLFNCILYCENQERMHYLLDFMQTVASHFPCRLFCIEHQANAPSGTYEQRHEELNEKSISFYDSLFVTSSTDSLCRIPFSLFPFLAPELPIVLFWDADPTRKDQVLSCIRPYLHRLIFDSETIEDLPAFADRMLKQPEVKSSADLNWSRLIGWREVFAKVFDTQERLEHLRHSSEVRIVYNARENRFFHHSQTQALYLQAWLAARMGWSYEGMTMHSLQHVLQYRLGQDKVRVVIEPMYMEQRAPGGLLSIDVVSRLGTEVAMDSRCIFGSVRVKSVCDASCTLPYNLPLRGSRLTSGFIQQLLYGKMHGHYAEMLQMLSQVKS